MNRLEPGRLLHTKDGRKIGNAIILECMAPRPDRASEPVFKIRTDFGNIVLFTSAEIAGYWHTDGEQRFCSIEQWSEDRDERLLIQPWTPEEADAAFLAHWDGNKSESTQAMGHYMVARAAWFAALGLEDPDA